VGTGPGTGCEGGEMRRLMTELASRKPKTLRFRLLNGLGLLNKVKKDQITRPKDEPYEPNISQLGLFILTEENFNRKPNYPARQPLPTLEFNFSASKCNFDASQQCFHDNFVIYSSCP
jgi:hypothetical protein